MERPTWHREAACKGREEIFIPKEASEELSLADRARLTLTMTNMALEICQGCPVRDECLQDALEFEREQGTRPVLVVGGMSANKRHKLLKGERV